MNFANVSSWSFRAQSYVERKVDADILGFVETHVGAAGLGQELNRFQKWGFRCSDRAAISTSASGFSGGCFTAVSKKLASYSLGPPGALGGLASEPDARYWRGRSVRLAGPAAGSWPGT